MQPLSFLLLSRSHLLKIYHVPAELTLADHLKKPTPSATRTTQRDSRRKRVQKPSD